MTNAHDALLGDGSYRLLIEAGVFIDLALADSCKRRITAAWREDYNSGN
jgi:hypothetical protein